MASLSSFSPAFAPKRGPITLGSDDAAVVIRAGCNGLEAVFLLLAGILAFPASWRQRGAALMTYLPLLFIVNVLRVLMLLFVMSQYPAHIDLFHYQIGQGIMVVFVMIFWVHYVRQATP
jgi:exosortase/archaeosortase family protein